MSTPFNERYPLLRAGLRALGLSAEKIDQVIQFIVELLDDREPSGPDLGAFRLRDDFLSPAEKSFFLVLRNVMGTDGEVLAKIRLGDLFYPSRGEHGERVGLRNRVDRKHVDFLVCRPQSFEPWFGIELDDASHRRAERKERDQLVDQIFGAARLPLLRIPTRAVYARAELEAVMREKAGFHRRADCGEAGNGPSATVQGTTASRPIAKETRQDVPREPCTPALPASGSMPPACPKCGAPMVLRTARSGAHAGGTFWGCRNFPQCRGMVKPLATQ